MYRRSPILLSHDSLSLMHRIDTRNEIDVFGNVVLCVRCCAFTILVTDENYSPIGLIQSLNNLSISVADICRVLYSYKEEFGTITGSEEMV